MEKKWGAKNTHIEHWPIEAGIKNATEKLEKPSHNALRPIHLDRKYPRTRGCYYRV